MCSCGFSPVPALLLTVMAAGFPDLLDTGTASGIPEHSRLEMHGIGGSTHFSIFARASEINLELLYVRMKCRKFVFFGELLAIWSFRCPKPSSPLGFVCLLVWDILLARSTHVVLSLDFCGSTVHPFVFVWKLNPQESASSCDDPFL